VVICRSGAEADFRVNGDVRDAIQCLKFDGVKTALICTQGAPLAHDSIKDLEIAQVCPPHIHTAHFPNTTNPTTVLLSFFWPEREMVCVIFQRVSCFPRFCPKRRAHFLRVNSMVFSHRQHFNAVITPGGSPGVASEELSGLLGRLGDFPSDRCIYVGTSGLEAATKLGMMAIKWTGDQGDVVRALEAACETSLVSACTKISLFHRPLGMLPTRTVVSALPTLLVAILFLACYFAVNHAYETVSFVSWMRGGAHIQNNKCGGNQKPKASTRTFCMSERGKSKSELRKSKIQTHTEHKPDPKPARVVLSSIRHLAIAGLELPGLQVNFAWTRDIYAGVLWKNSKDCTREDEAK
jgi:hypothetical protein